MLSSPGKVASRNPGLLSKLDLITARSSCSIHQRSGGGRSGDCFAVLPRAPPTPACYLRRGHVPILGTATALAAVPGGNGPRDVPLDQTLAQALRSCASALLSTSIATPEGYYWVCTRHEGTTVQERKKKGHATKLRIFFTPINGSTQPL